MLGSGSGSSERSGTRDLTKGADCRSDGPGRKGKGGGGAATPAAKTRGGMARDSPELGVPAAPGAKTTRAQVGRDQRDMSDPPGAKAGLGGRSSCGYDGGGGSARRRVAGVRRSGLC
jgi:hypothetical protein